MVFQARTAAKAGTETKKTKTKEAPTREGPLELQTGTTKCVQQLQLCESVCVLMSSVELPLFSVQGMSSVRSNSPMMTLRHTADSPCTCTFAHTHTYTLAEYKHTQILIEMLAHARTPNGDRAPKWEKRFFELASTGYMHYYKKEGGKNVGSIYLRGSTARVDPADACVFIIQSGALLCE